MRRISAVDGRLPGFPEPDLQFSVDEAHAVGPHFIGGGDGVVVRAALLVLPVPPTTDRRTTARITHNKLVTNE